MLAAIMSVGLTLAPIGVDIVSSHGEGVDRVVCVKEVELYSELTQIVQVAIRERQLRVQNQRLLEELEAAGPKVVEIGVPWWQTTLLIVGGVGAGVLTGALLVR